MDWTKIAVALFLENWAVWVVAGAVIGHSKGRIQAGSLLAFFFGAFGVFCAALMQTKEEIDRAAEKRRADFEAAIAAHEMADADDSS